MRDLGVGDPMGGGRGRADADVAVATIEALYRERFTATSRLAFLLTGDRAAADDLAQEAFARLYRSRATVENPPAFLRAALVNLCHDHRRRADTARRARPAAIGHAIVGAGDDAGAARRLRLLSGDGGSAAPGADAQPAGAVPRSVDATWLAVQALPSRRRDAVILRYYADLPTDEIARLLGCRPSTVRSLLKRALDSLEEVLTDER